MFCQKPPPKKMTTFKLLFAILSITFHFGRPWILRDTGRSRQSFLRAKDDDVIIDVEILDADSDHGTKSASVLKRNIVMITPELFPRLAQRQTNVHKKNNPHVGYVHADQLSENQSNDLVRIMQWEKQVGDTIRKGETILLCEGEESLTGASSSLRVLKDVIAEDDCMLVEIKVASGPVDFHTPLGFVEPLENIIEADLEGAIDAEIESENTDNKSNQKEEEEKRKGEQQGPQQTKAQHQTNPYDQLREQSKWYEQRRSVVQPHNIMQTSVKDPFGTNNAHQGHSDQYQRQKQWYDLR